MAALGTTLGSYVPNPLLLETAKTANYTVTAAENGTLFTNTGASTTAIVFTLPALAAGLVYEFQVVDNGSVTVASVAGSDIIYVNNATASSLAFSTASEKIGGRLLFRSNAAGTKWYVHNKSAGANAASGNRISVT